MDYSRNQTGSTYEFGVPIPPCVEVLSSKGSEPAPGAAADVENLVTILGYLVDLPPRQISYSTLFTRRSHRRSEVFFESVLRGHGRAYLISFLDGVGAGEGASTYVSNNTIRNCRRYPQLVWTRVMAIFRWC